MLNPLSKPVMDGDEDDTLSLIANGVQENISLDYKGSDSLQNTDRRKREIRKDVSALAGLLAGC